MHVSASRRAMAAACLTSLALATVALSDGLFNGYDSNARTLNTAGGRLAGGGFATDVAVGDVVTADEVSLKGGNFVLGTGVVAKKKLVTPPPTGIEPLSAPVVATRLDGNFPNPFNPATTVRFSLAEARHATLKIYDVKGRLVRTLVDETLDAGVHERSWNGRTSQGGLATSGVYFARLQAGEHQERHKMVMSR